MIERGHIDDLLVDFLYGELGEREAREVESHLSSCSRCAGEVARLRGVRAAVAALPVAEVPPRATEVILRRARELAPRRRRWSWMALVLRPSVAGVFLFVLVLGVGLYIVRSSSGPAEHEAVPAVGRFAPEARTAAPAPAAPAATPTPALPLADRSLSEAPAAAGPEGKAMPRPARRARKGVPARPRIIARVARPTPESLFPGVVGRGAGGPDRAPSKEVDSLALGARPLEQRPESPAPTAPPARPVYRIGKGPTAEDVGNVRMLEPRQQTLAAEPAASPARLENAPASGVSGRRAQLAEAERDLREGRKDDAARNLMKVASSGGREAAQALLALAELRLREGKARAAIDLLERLVRTHHGHATPRVYELLAGAYDKVGDAAAAERARAVARRRFAPAAEKASSSPPASPVSPAAR